MGEICKWSNIKLFIYGKRLLAGTAAFYLRSETGIRSWTILRNRLLNKFSSQMNSANILTARVKNYEETYQQYMLKMMEIAKQGYVSEDAIINYIISGIQDSEINKILLYGATPISEFKVKLQLFTKMKFKMNMAEHRISRISQNTNNSKISGIQRNII